MREAVQKLALLQAELKAPKGQFNKFGGYKYRSCEDILEAVKPLLAKHNCVVKLSDEITGIGDRIYVKATATLCDVETGDITLTTAYAREEETKKGMDGSQITGAASSYARKYALNGLFAIDDTKDSDATNTHGKEPEATEPTEYRCHDCGKKFEDYTTKTNKFYSAAQMYHISETKHGRALCTACAKKPENKVD